MDKKIILILFFLTSLYADFSNTINRITPELKILMIKGHSWKKECPVHVNDLRLVQLTHWDFDDKQSTGKLIVHKDIAHEVVEIFHQLYTQKYPIRQMKLMHEFSGDDFESIEADNTSAFNCRYVENTRRWSKHALGKAIDINPLENPYISRKGKIYHKESYSFRKRIHKNNSLKDKAMLLKNDDATSTFAKFGWRWGGNLKTIKDYQHFAK